MSICVILGAGGHAREVYFSIRESRTPEYERFVFVDDIHSFESIECGGVSWPIVRNWNFEKYRDKGKLPKFVVGVGYPKTKVVLVEKALEAGLEPAPTVIHQSAIIQDSSCQLGFGGTIGAGCILTTNVRLHDFVALGAGTILSHDVVVEKYVTCCPGARVAGNVRLGVGVFLGIGSTVKEKIRIAPFVTVGAQGCVVHDVGAPEAVVAGVPARII